MKPGRTIDTMLNRIFDKIKLKINFYATVCASVYRVLRNQLLWFSDIPCDMSFIHSISQSLTLTLLALSVFVHLYQNSIKTRILKMRWSLLMRI